MAVPRGALALIPARGGSKGIPGKNLQTVGGVPLVCRSIRAALASNGVGRVVVSTDDEAIAAAAETEGAEVIRRPVEIAAFFLGIANITLLVRRSVWNYPFGIVMVSLYAWVFYGAKLYSDALLQIFFFVVQCYGWAQNVVAASTKQRCDTVEKSAWSPYNISSNY